MKQPLSSHVIAERSKLFAHYVDGLRQSLDSMPWSELHETVHAIVTAWATGHHVFVLGNGGSASTASHLACDLSKNTAQPGLPAMRAVSLNDNMAIFSALANDLGYEQVFAQQIQTLAQPYDVVLAISASGNSPNVLNGLRIAAERRATTIALCGNPLGKMVSMVDIAMVTASESVEQIEDLHLMIAHIITVAVRNEMQAEVARTISRLTPMPINGYANGAGNGAGNGYGNGALNGNGASGESESANPAAAEMRRTTHKPTTSAA